MLINITLEKAVDAIIKRILPLGTEWVKAENALGRTLAQDVIAPMDQPPFDRSPLDGYALRSQDLLSADKNHGVTLKVIGTVYAGDAAKTPVEPGKTVRVATGAMLPAGCDCVLRKEDSDEGFPLVSCFRSLKAWENYSCKGEDYSKGSCLLTKGTRLNSACLGLLAGAGIFELCVQRRPKVGVLCTGDEEVSAGTYPLPPGKIYNSNLQLILSRLQELGIWSMVGKQVGDSSKTICDSIDQLAQGCDLLVTTGGVSVGDKDLLLEALSKLKAETIFRRIKMKPGSPAAFSIYRKKPVLSLSGNPFAAAATFELLVRPAIQALTQENHFAMKSKAACLENDFSKSSLQRRLIRGVLKNGRVWLPEGHSSGVLSSFAGCNCFVDIPAGSDCLKAGERVTVLLL